METHSIHTLITTFVKREDGPTTVEYAVMLALIVTVCVGAISLLGEKTNDTFLSLSDFNGPALAAITNPRNLSLPSAWNNGNPSGGTWKNESQGQQITSRPDGGAVMDASSSSSPNPWVRMRGSDGDQYTWQAN